MTLRSRSVAVVSAVALALAFGGCGGKSDGGLSATRQARLDALVQHVRTAAESLDREGSLRALAALQVAVAAYENSGDIGTARAAQILTAADDVRSRFDLIPTTTTSTSTTTTTTSPPVGRGRGHKKAGGNGNGGGD
jgi:hypothetical protein